MNIIQKTKTIKNIIKSNGFFGILIVLVSKLSDRLLFSLALEFDEIMLVLSFIEKKNSSYNSKDKKIMFDIGARFGSSLKHFANNDWKIFAFEPDSSNREGLVEKFGDYPNIIIDERAVSDKNINNVEFYSSHVSTGISSLTNFHSSHVQSEMVDTITLESFCEENKIRAIDFLKIDTEGYDYFVLKGLPWHLINPTIILCEFENFKTIPLGYDYHDIAKYLLKYGYKVIVSEWYPIVKYGGPHKWRRHEKYPCELEDNMGWGNLIATKDEEIYKDLISLCEKFKNRTILWEKINRHYFNQ
jgi:FkbM family methyltransferase